MLACPELPNPAGEAFRSVDPAGTDNRQAFDAAGRPVENIENFTQGQPPAPDRNRTTRFAYAPNGQMSTLTCLNADTGDQVTEWIYGVTLESFDIASNDLLARKVFPDPLGTGDTAVHYRFNRLGEVKGMTDQLATEHAYPRDAFGRVTEDQVTLAVGSPVDPSVLRIAYGYENRGPLATATSFDAASGGNQVNKVERVYNAYLLMTEDRQTHGGTGATAVTVGYEYENGANNNVRLKKTIYPDGREIVSAYGSANGQDDILSRVASLVDDTSTLATYAYLGLARVVVAAYPEPGVEMTLIKQTGEPNGSAGDKYAGLDRFGRLVDNRWIESGSSPAVDLERARYTFDRAGNRTSRTNPVAAALSVNMDEDYTYDGLYQVATRGLGVGTGTPAGRNSSTTIRPATGTATACSKPGSRTSTSRARTTAPTRSRSSMARRH